MVCLSEMKSESWMEIIPNRQQVDDLSTNFVLDFGLIWYFC